MRKKIMIVFAVVIVLAMCFIWPRFLNTKTNLIKSSYTTVPQSIDKDNIKFTYKCQDENYTTSTNEIALTIENIGSANIEFGSTCIVEKFEDGAWYVIPFVDNIGFDMILNVLQPQKNREIKFNVEVLDYKLIQGKYRVVKEFTSEGNSMVAAAEFNILP